VIDSSPVTGAHPVTAGDEMAEAEFITYYDFR
jgi:hypothetical protein